MVSVNMISVTEAIKTRRSIRKFADREVPDEMVEQMLEAARLAPSGGNRQPWRFVVVKDKELKKELRRIGRNQAFIEEAAVVFVCFGDLSRYTIQASTEIHQQFVQTGVQATLSGTVAQGHPSAVTREEAMVHLKANTYIAIEHLVLTAMELGLGSCWVGAYSNNPAVNQLFGLPDHYVGVAGVMVGYPAGEIPSQRPRLTLDEIILQPEGKNVWRRSK